jgi:hypothetical protein
VPYLQGATMQIRNTSWKRIALIIGIAFVAIQLVLLCVYLIFADAIQRSIRETAIQYIRTQAQSAVSDSSTRLAVDVGNIDYTYLTGTLEIESIRVQYYDNANGRERSLRLALPSIEVTGLKFWDLLDGDGISIGTISVDKPRISLKGISGDTPDSATTSSADDADSTIVQLPRIPNIDSILHNVFVNAFPAFVQPLVIEQVEVRDLHVQSLDDNPTTLFGGNLSGASIRFGPVKVIPGERPVGRPFGDLAIDIDNWRRDYTSGKAVRTHGFHVRVNNNDSSLVVDSLLLRSPREYDYIVKGVRFSYRSMELGISWFSIAPSLNDNAFFARQKYRGDRFRISAGPVVLRDIDFDALARREAFHVTTVDVQSLDVNLVSNVALPKNPRAPRPKMLNEIAQSIPFTLAIDSVRVRKASIVYGERWPRSTNPATLRWDNLSLLATNCKNKTENSSEPLRISVKGLFMKHAPLETTFTIPLMSATYQLRASGSVGKFDATSLNSFLPISDNMKIRSGLSSGTTFNFVITGRTCKGTMNLRYTNLKVDKVNATTKKEGNLFDAVISLVANWFVLRTHNDGADFQQGPIEYALPPGCSFMETIWLPIRDGLLESASR